MAVLEAPHEAPAPAATEPRCANPFCHAGIVAGYHYLLFHGEPLRYQPMHDCTFCDGTGLPSSMLAVKK